MFQFSATHMPQAVARSAARLRARLRAAARMRRRRCSSCDRQCFHLRLCERSRNLHFRVPIMGTQRCSKILPRTCLKQLRARLRACARLRRRRCSSCDPQCFHLRRCAQSRNFHFQVPILSTQKCSKLLPRTCLKQLRARLRAAAWLRHRRCSSCDPQCFHLRLCMLSRSLHFQVPILGTQKCSKFLPRASLKQLRARLRAAVWMYRG